MESTGPEVFRCGKVEKGHELKRNGAERSLIEMEQTGIAWIITEPNRMESEYTGIEKERNRGEFNRSGIVQMRKELTWNSREMT